MLSCWPLICWKHSSRNNGFPRLCVIKLNLPYDTVWLGIKECFTILIYKESLTWMWFRNVWETHDVTNTLNDKYFRGSDSKWVEVRKAQTSHNSSMEGVQHCQTSRTQSHQIKATPGHYSPWVSVPSYIPSHTWRRVQHVNVLVRPP